MLTRQGHAPGVDSAHVVVVDQGAKYWFHSGASWLDQTLMIGFIEQLSGQDMQINNAKKVVILNGLSHRYILTDLLNTYNVERKYELVIPGTAHYKKG